VARDLDQRLLDIPLGRSDQDYNRAAPRWQTAGRARDQFAF